MPGGGLQPRRLHPHLGGLAGCDERDGPAFCRSPPHQRVRQGVLPTPQPARPGGPGTGGRLRSGELLAGPARNRLLGARTERLMDLERVEALLKLMHEYGVEELGYEDEGSRIELRLQGAEPVATAAVAAPAVSAAPVAPQPAGDSTPGDPDTITIDAPMVGTFYRSSKPGAKAYVEVGEKVHAGKVLCIIEAMKLMNELEAEIAGTVVEILVDNGKPVQFGQALFRIRPD